MAYTSGTVTSSVELLDRLREFLLANGWLINLFEGDSTGRRLHVQKDNNYVNLKAAIGVNIFPAMANAVEEANYGIGVNPSTGFDTTRDWHSQPGTVVDTSGRPVGAAVKLSKSGDIEYHFFSLPNPDVVFIATTYGPVSIDPSQNSYQLLAFGNVNKIGAWNGGEFVAASKPGYYLPNEDILSTANPTTYQTRIFSQTKYSTMFVRGAVDAFTGTWLCNGEPQVAVEYGYTGKRVVGLLKETGTTGYLLPNYELLQSTASTTGYTSNVHNALSVVLPFYLLTQRDPNGDNLFSPLGTIPHAYFCNLKYLAPGSAYPLDYMEGNVYKVFPFSKKGATMGYDGIAIRYLP